MDDQIIKIENNFIKFEALCSKIESRQEPVKRLLESVKTRLATCPASPSQEYYGAYPGGLVAHSLKVLANCLKLIKAFELKFNNESIIITCLFRDLGKIGDETEDLFLEQDNKYSLDKGWMYKYNEKLQYMSHPHRTLYLLQKFDINLSQEEFLSILLTSGDNANSDEFRPYNFKSPTLAEVVIMSHKMAVLQEKSSSG